MNHFSKKCRERNRKLKEENLLLKKVLGIVARKKNVENAIVQMNVGITKNKLKYWGNKMLLSGDIGYNTHGGARNWLFDENIDIALQETLWELYRFNKWKTTEEYASQLSRVTNLNVPKTWVKSILKNNAFTFKKGIPYNKRKFSLKNIFYYRIFCQVIKQ